MILVAAAGKVGAETVDAAMQGVSGVVLVSPAMPVHELNIVVSAVRAGAGHVVKITSEASADSPIARRRGQAEIENRLIASGLGYTLLRNNAYMQNAPVPHAGNTYWPTGPEAITFSDAAAVLSKVLGHPITFPSPDSRRTDAGNGRHQPPRKPRRNEPTTCP